MHLRACPPRLQVSQEEAALAAAEARVAAAEARLEDVRGQVAEVGQGYCMTTRGMEGFGWTCGGMWRWWGSGCGL